MSCSSLQSWSYPTERLPVRFPFASLSSSSSCGPASSASSRSSGSVGGHNSKPSVDSVSAEDLRGTRLFHHVRHKFQTGLATLEDLQTFLEMSGADGLQSEQMTVQNLLQNMMVMAKWLVDFLHSAETIGAFDLHTSWARSTIRELRTELHCYSWRVMRITTILREWA